MILLKFEKSIKGSSDVDGFKDWIKLSSYQWGVGRSVSMGTTRHPSDASISELTATKEMDEASTELFKQACDGMSLGKAEIQVIHTSGDQKGKPYLYLELTEALISSYSTSATGTPPSSESFSINFTGIKYKYDHYDGTKVNKGKEKSFDLTKLTAK